MKIFHSWKIIFLLISNVLRVSERPSELCGQFFRPFCDLLKTRMVQSCSSWWKRYCTRDMHAIPLKTRNRVKCFVQSDWNLEVKLSCSIEDRRYEKFQRAEFTTREMNAGVNFSAFYPAFDVCSSLKQISNSYLNNSTVKRLISLIHQPRNDYLMLNRHSWCFEEFKWNEKSFSIGKKCASRIKNTNNLLNFQHWKISQEKSCSKVP